MLVELGTVLELSEGWLAGFILVFVRIGAVMALLPGFGEQMIPVRVRLAITFAFSLVTWPMISEDLLQPAPDRPFALMILIEAAIGLALGLAIRLFAIALQIAGTVAAQSTSLGQIFGPGATPDPMPAIGNILLLAGITLALVSGLHVKAALAMARSYEILPMGLPIPASDVAAWGTAQVAKSFALGFSLAAPFVIAGFAYNLALGAINKAMPQLMVAFVGAPAITAAGLLLLMLSAPVILTFWNGQLDRLLADPMAMPR